MKLIKEHLDIGVEVWTKENLGYTNKNESKPCKIIGFNESKSAVMIDNQADGHCGGVDYYYDKQGNSLGDYDGEGINDRRYMSIDNIERIAYPNLSKFIGRKVKSLVDNLFCGDLKKGDIGIIVDSRSIKYPKQTILCSKLFYEKDEWNKFKLLSKYYEEELGIKSDLKRDDKGIPLKELKPIQSNPFKVGDKFQFISLDEYSVPEEIWLKSNGKFKLNNTFNTQDIYTVSEINNSVSIRTKEKGLMIPVMLLKKFEEKQEEVPKYFDGTPLVDVKPGWYINKIFASSKKYVRIVSRNICGIKNDYHQQVFYDAFTDNFIDIEFKKGYWAAEYLNRSLIKISDKEIEEIKKKNTISTSVKMYNASTPLKEFKIGEWYKSPWDYEDTKMQDGQNALYIRVSKVEVLSSNNGFFYNRVHFDRITRDFLHIESPSAGTGSWANRDFDVKATHIDEKKIARIKEEACRPKITEECGTIPPNISGIGQDGSPTYEENLLDKYEHQVIKLTKPRTKNKLIIL